MQPYHQLLSDVLYYGEERQDRTGTGTLSLFAPLSCKYDLSKGFPLVTTKRVFWRGVVEELLWMLSGSTNNNDLTAKGVHIWDEWATENGDLGPVYGAQWRKWGEKYHYTLVNVKKEEHNGYTHVGFSRNEIPGIDQITNLISGILTDPTSRRHIVSAWNVEALPQMALAPCHCFFQVYIRDGKYLDLMLYQRSADLFLGVPFNIASYALLTHLLAHVTGYQPGVFTHNLGDTHIYLNHLEQVKEQLQRDFRPLPELRITAQHGTIFDYEFRDFELIGYNPHPPIKGDVSV